MNAQWIPALITWVVVFYLLRELARLNGPTQTQIDAKKEKARESAIEKQMAERFTRLLVADAAERRRNLFGVRGVAE
ncbi:MAG: hypothetical protein H7255_09065 [Ramlibacter sp.]|nr:hypothetical protein [Ramlibacter sp.]